jgi:thioredoxin 1
MGIFDWFSSGPAVQPTPIRTLPQWQEQVQQSAIPVILEVWSDTCPPCRRLIPVLEKVATRYEGKVRVVTVGTDADGPLLRMLQVRSTPTLVIYDNGEELGRMVGFRPEGWFDEMIRTEFPDVSA